jgi:hypothetical protein
MDCSELSASCIDGRDCLAVGLGTSFSSPDVLRDSGGDSKPASEPGGATVGDGWWLPCGCDGAAKGCIGLGLTGVEWLRW